MNTTELPEYAEALTVLAPVLHDLPPKIIAIDGRPGTGKSTLGRFLSWKFNISLLETDLYLVRGQEHLKYREEAIQSVIKSRMDSDRPMIFEGMIALKLLNQLNHTPSFHIRLERPSVPQDATLDAIWQSYQAQFSQAKERQLVLNLP